MAKKKKPASNPNRGFATTSIASKAKPESSKEPATPESPAVKSSEGQTSAEPEPQKGGELSVPATEAREKEMHELSPEELEKRLEDAELLALVESYSAKCNRDAARHTDKLQMQYRTLRKQAQPLYIRNLLPDEIMWQILDLARDDFDASNRADSSNAGRALKAEKEDELAAQLWTLQRTLLAVGFSKDQASRATTHLLSHLPIHDSGGTVWGFDQCFDWLLCHEQEADLPTVNSHTGQASLSTGADSSPDTFNFEQISSDIDDVQVNVSAPVTSHKRVTEATDSPPLSAEEFEVSDLDSDLEPDELLKSYLNAKTRLFEAQPELADPKPPKWKLKSDARGRPGAGKPTSRSVLKLQQKISRIEGDILFDQRDADAQWIQTRNRLAQEAAERRKYQFDSQPGTHDAEKPDTPPESSNSTNGVENDSNHESEQDDNAIGDLFGAEPNGFRNATIRPTEETSMDIVTSIRDFKRPAGVSPRRILEDACHARDPSARLTYRLISLTAFSNRHMLVINWSKEQRPSFPLKLDETLCQASSRLYNFTMKTVATPDERQSESYVSVMALFQIFSASAKEDKTYLRLAPAWRDLYLELVNRRKIEIEANDKEEIRDLRDRARKAINDLGEEDEEDVVHTQMFKKRIVDSDRSRSSSAGPRLIDASDQELQQLWQTKTQTPSYQQMLKMRMNLPMFLFKEAALAAVEGNQVTIICGETGCGKSTQMPAFILEQQLSLGKPCKIYCTEPRRISAITLAQRVSQELGEARSDVGTMRSLVGYAIRLESQTSRNTRLVYATTGIVLRMLESGDGLRDVTHIVIDEVHERSIETDFLLIILRTLMVKRPDLKVILMSATVDAQKFASYFNGAPILTVPGRTFPVEQKFLEDAISVTGHVVGEDDRRSNDEDDLDESGDGAATSQAGTDADYLKQYNAATRRTLAKFDEYRLDYELIIKLINQVAYHNDYSQYSHAILVFLPGIGEIRALSDIIGASPLARSFEIYPLHSAIPSEDQQRAFDPPPRGMRKIVLSTNIAETGVTIPDVTCVIDTGKHKEMRFDERRQISRLLESAISRANAKQRRGRAGRVQPGLCFHLFTKQRHDTIMASDQTPEMLRLSLQDLVMRVKICKLGDIQTTLSDALDPPSAKNVRRAIDALIEVGALTPKEELTPLGQQLSKLPLDPYLGKLVLYGTIFSCLDVSLTLAAILTSKSPFTVPLNNRHAADTARLAFMRNESDLLTDYNAYTSWRRTCTQNPGHEPRFSRTNFLSSQTLGNIEDLKAQLLSSLADGGVVSLSPPERHALSRIQNSSHRPGSSKPRAFVHVPAHYDTHTPFENPELVTAVIAWSFHPKLLVREGKGWRNVASNQQISLHPTSILRSVPVETMARVKMLSFYSILQSSGGARKLNASSLTTVNPLALVLLAGEANFLTYAGVISIDGARLRFLVEDNPGRETAPGVWKTMLALKVLRRRSEEVVEMKWRRPGAVLSKRLGRWWELWENVLREIWARRE